MVDRERISLALDARGTQENFRSHLWSASLALSATLIASSAANFFLARHFLRDKEGGSEEYVEALGTITWVGYVVIGLPMMAAMVVILLRFMRGITALTGLSSDEFMRHPPAKNATGDADEISPDT
jgi:hypothetical protein